jgi:hypothetical protein
MGLFGKSKEELKLEAQVESLKRENLLLRSQLSDFQSLVQSLNDKAAEERAGLIDRMTAILRPSIFSTPKPSHKAFTPVFPGYRPDLRPPDPEPEQVSEKS